MGGCGLQAGCGCERSINLIADGIGIPILVGTADGGIGNMKTLAISGNGNLRHHGDVERNSFRRETYSMKIKEADGTLRFSTGTSGTAVVIGTFHLGTFSQQIDGMLAAQTFHIRHIDRVSGGGSVRIGRNLQGGNLLAIPNGICIGPVQHHTNGEGTVSAWSEAQIELCAIAFACGGKSLHALAILLQSAKAEILKSHHTSVSDASQIHAVVPHIVIVLHPVVSGHIAGQTGRIVGIRGKTVNLESFAGDLGSCVAGAVGCLGRPLVVFGIGVITNDAYLSTLSDGFLVPSYLYGRHHSLASITESSGRTVIKHIPLAVDFLQRTVGVMGCIGSGEPCAVCVGHHATRVYQYTTRTPGTERRIAEGIAQGGIGGTQSVIGAAVTREHHHILVAHLSDGRGLEEVEVAGILFLIKCGILCAGRVSYLAVTRAGWDEIVVNLGARTKGVHGLRVQFKSRGVLESVVDVCTETTFVIGVFLVCYIFHED